MDHGIYNRFQKCDQTSYLSVFIPNAGKYGPENSECGHFLRNEMHDLIQLVITKWDLAMGDFQRQPPEVFCKKGVLKNSAKFTEKHLRQSLFFK